MIPHRLKDTWRGKGRRAQKLAGALNGMARWANLFRADPPLEVTDGGGFPVLRLLATETPFLHPWRITWDSDAETFGVAGGRVHDGLAWHSVAALADVDCSDPTYVWLRVKHYNDPGSAMEHVLAHGAELPASTYSAPVLSTTAALTTGYAQVIIPIGLVDPDDGPTQYRLEDAWVPAGLTYSVSMHVGWSYSSDVWRQVVMHRTVVLGRDVALGSPSNVDLFDTGPCPESSTVP